jgi:hypothetical protein
LDYDEVVAVLDYIQQHDYYYVEQPYYNVYNHLRKRVGEGTEIFVAAAAALAGDRKVRVAVKTKVVTNDVVLLLKGDL